MTGMRCGGEALGINTEEDAFDKEVLLFYLMGIEINEKAMDIWNADWAGCSLCDFFSALCYND